MATAHDRASPSDQGAPTEGECRRGPISAMLVWMVAQQMSRHHGARLSARGPVSGTGAVWAGVAGRQLADRARSADALAPETRSLLLQPPP